MRMQDGFDCSIYAVHIAHLHINTFLIKSILAYRVCTYCINISDFIPNPSSAF